MDEKNKPQLKLNTLYLTDEEVIYFQAFMEHYDIIKVMVDSNVFKVEFGKVELNFLDKQLNSIRLDRFLWKKPKENTEIQ